MIASEVTEEPPVYLRIFEKPNRHNHRMNAADPEPPNDNQVLIFDTETTTDTNQELRFGIAREYALGHLCRTIVFTGLLTEAERRTVSRWAELHRAELLTVEHFVSEVFLPLAYDMRAVVVGFNLPFDLARIAADWGPKDRIGRKEAWTLWPVPRSHPQAAYIPKIRVQRVDSTKGFIHFTGTKGRFRRYRGAFVDLRTFVHVLTGEKKTLGTSGTAIGCTLRKSEVDFDGAVTPRFLDYCLNDVALTAELYGRCLDRYREFGLTVHPSQLYSPASLAKAALDARGIVPPTLLAHFAGRIMAAFYAGKVECRVVGREVKDVAVLDFTSQFPSLYCLLGAERFLTAERIRTRESTADIRAWLDSLTLEDLLRPGTWADPRMWTLCEVEAAGEILPIRSTYSGKASQPATIGWNHVTTEPGLTLPYLVPDLIAAKLLSGTAPRIVRATTFTPIGRQNVRPLALLGVEVGPGDDLVRALSEARIREKSDKREGWEGRAQGLKIVSNSLAYGITVEVNRKRKAGSSTVYGLGGDPFEVEDTETEEPGEVYFPLLGATLTAGSHLLLAMADKVVESLGGEGVYCDTDSVFVTPSRIAPEVARQFDSLNPYSRPVPFLKDETEAKAPLEEYPKGSPDIRPRFFGLSCKRYCLFVRDKAGRPHVFRTGKEKGASDHGLGSFEAPGDRKAFVAMVWEAIIEEGPRAGDRFAGIPATSPFALSSPQLSRRVRKLGLIRPFTFMTARLLEPSPDPDADRSELVPFVSTKDLAARVALMELPRQRSWGSVVEAFARHRDRKCTLDSGGRMVRRHVTVREDRIAGLGKEANRIEVARVLGVGPAGARARVLVPWAERILALPLSWAAEHGIDKRNFARLKKRLRKGKVARGYHSGLLSRVQALLREV
ncbi:MAG: hypothetical protein L3K19_05930 [Thermoplasmata archaeon]|nr:hypothetical protein [Thermoplasmata archaeon]